MKKILLLTIAVLHLSMDASAQNIFVANNNPGAASGTNPAANVFTGATALQDAIAAAATVAPFDIIYVVPGVVNYGNITIDRGITIFGIGLRPAKDIGAKSLISQIFIESSNVRISGLVSVTQWNIGTGSTGTTFTNITIENSRFRNIAQNNSASLTIDNVLIRNNVLLNDGWSAVDLYVTSNVTITNNVIYCERTGGSMRGNGLLIYNNLFVNDGSISTYNAILNVDNSLFDHNIFYGTSPALSSSSTGNVWDDNLSFSTPNDIFEVVLNGNTSNSTNLEGIDPLFVSMPLTISWNNAYDFSLQTTPVASPALNINGTDIGPSGGAVPFNFEGNLLPLIQSVIVPAVIPVGTDLPVTIKAKGN